jgi:hypothetical protein
MVNSWLSGVGVGRQQVERASRWWTHPVELVRSLTNGCTHGDLSPANIPTAQQAHESSQCQLSLIRCRHRRTGELRQYHTRHPAPRAASQIHCPTATYSAPSVQKRKTSSGRTMTPQLADAVLNTCRNRPHRWQRCRLAHIGGRSVKPQPCLTLIRHAKRLIQPSSAVVTFLLLQKFGSASWPAGSADARNRTDRRECARSPSAPSWLRVMPG